MGKKQAQRSDVQSTVVQAQRTDVQSTAVSDIRKRNCENDSCCFTKARERGQMTFTVVEQDITAVRTIAHWMYLNIEDASEDKLRLALEECLEMRKDVGLDKRYAT